MGDFLPSFIMGFREGLEAFLLIAIMIKYITKADQLQLKGKIIQGCAAGLVLSFLLGLFLNAVSAKLGGIDSLTKVWESAASFIALGLVTTFIIWMIRHSADLAQHVQGQVKENFSAWGVFMIALVIIAREGTEVAIFSFAGKYPYVYVMAGIGASLVMTMLIFFSLVKVNLSLLFRITLAYLILQAGFLLGYTLHEGLSALKGYDVLLADSAIFTKAFDLSKTILSYKNGLLGIPLHALFGWYSKPEWIQFVVQYFYTFAMFGFWFKFEKKRSFVLVDSEVV